MKWDLSLIIVYFLEQETKENETMKIYDYTVLRKMDDIFAMDFQHLTTLYRSIDFFRSLAIS